MGGSPSKQTISVTSGGTAPASPIGEKARRNRKNLAGAWETFVERGGSLEKFALFGRLGCSVPGGDRCLRASAISRGGPGAHFPPAGSRKNPICIRGPAERVPKKKALKSISGAPKTMGRATCAVRQARLFRCFFRVVWGAIGDVILTVFPGAKSTGAALGNLKITRSLGFAGFPNRELLAFSIFNAKYTVSIQFPAQGTQPFDGGGPPQGGRVSTRSRFFY